MKKFKKMLVLVLALVMAVSIVGCTQKAEEPAEAPAETEAASSEPDAPAELTGTVTISGSTSVEKVGVALAEEFMALNSGVEVTYQGIGSSGGVKNAKDGTTIIGTASRNLKTEEKEWGLTEIELAYDGIAVIAHPDNGVEGLTMDQVKAIYIGEITNWSQVGGADAEIVVVSREDGSGTRGAFEEIVDFEDALKEGALIAEGNGNVQTTVAGNPLAIGYVSFTYINETVKPLLVDGVAPTVENVVSKEYGVSRPFMMVWMEENMTEASQAFVDFAMSPEGQDIVEEKGAIKAK
ncbi:phosphate ABC transporter substrate-binding protein, PhoT family [Dethiosulfatibacter aminovorans DSM 17477]|uniref:Phosphate-binding protein n=1 Tax=Dethiosulfatibacter aminovorans DSM 17477 TaxID=1121476 RepID=A0A1M6I386_9FIRM|nr:phosphate ABC transporter substrate-binding protein [Dethiosulfatibacter aminovorans]SHJ28870.1 phosphate ABC transporter substrate-binding protein, PhoT family [Dethiosulfatibacter aminovorans DSM 17477]